jgi:hypothetical protein
MTDLRQVYKQAKLDAQEKIDKAHAQGKQPSVLGVGASTGGKAFMRGLAELFNVIIRGGR